MRARSTVPGRPHRKTSIAKSLFLLAAMITLLAPIASADIVCEECTVKCWFLIGCERFCIWKTQPIGANAAMVCISDGYDCRNLGQCTVGVF